MEVIVRVGVTVDVGVAVAGVPVTVAVGVVCVPVGVTVWGVPAVRVVVTVGVWVTVGRVPVIVGVEVGVGVCGPKARTTLPTKASTNPSTDVASPVVAHPPFASAF